MPDPHRFTAMVTPTPGQVDADNHLAMYGRLHPKHHRMQLGWNWELRDVTTGQTLEAGHADDEDDAIDAADRARERAEDVDAARVMRELGLVEEE